MTSNKNKTEKLQALIAAKKESRQRLAELREGVLARLNVERLKVADQAEAQIRLNSIENTASALDQEIADLQVQLDALGKVEERRGAADRLKVLAREAQAARTAYEQAFQELDRLLSEKAPGLAKSYQDWHKLSKEFFELLVTVEPGVQELNHVDGPSAMALTARAREFTNGLKVDLPTLLSWPNMRCERSYSLPPLESKFSNAIDLAHEIAQYGRKLYEKERMDNAVRYNRGMLQAEQDNKSPRRAYFPTIEVLGKDGENG